jgi:hypothetical protein
MQRKLLFALRLKVAYRFIERLASGRARKYALRGTDLFGSLVTGLDGFADNEIKDVHEEWCSVDGSRQENKIDVLSVRIGLLRLLLEGLHEAR